MEIPQKEKEFIKLFTGEITEFFKRQEKIALKCYEIDRPRYKIIIKEFVKQLSK